MPLTNEEKRMIQAYNMGYTLAKHEPEVMDTIAKGNHNSELIRAMTVGRDHYEFHSNISRTADYSRDYKTGFYNGRSLAQFSPDVLNEMIVSDGLSNEFKKGLSAAKTAYNIRSIKDKAAKEKAEQKDAVQDPDWLKKKEPGKANVTPAKDKTKSKGQDMDR